MTLLAVILLALSIGISIKLYNEPTVPLIILNTGFFIAAQIAFFTYLKRRNK